MWKILNSPIVVAVVAVLLLFGVMKLQKPRLAMEVRAVSAELDRIVREGGTDAEKAKAIRDFANSVASNLREGFSSGFSSGSDGVKELDAAERTYLETKDKIEITNIKKVASSWDSREKYVYLIKNNSDKYLTSLNFQMEYYKDGELIDSEQKWLSNIKVLSPGQSISVSIERNLPKDSEGTYKDMSGELKVVPISFAVKKAPQ
jgi:hypothetical protein